LSGWWDLAYRSGAPWDFGTPPDELVELVEGGYLKPCRALDIGCGTGTSVTYLASKGFDAFGLDISKVAIRKAFAKARDLGVKCNLRTMDFLNIEAVSKLATTFDVILDVGCFHSLSCEDRLTYKQSLNFVSQPRSIYLLWCFLRGSRWSYGPPGVEQDEVERTLSKQFRVVEKRRLNTSFREMMFYIMRRSSEEESKEVEQ
jgi:cyclopropane fatty-acyl-phospholipid synthase-like methyltransferase